MTTSIPLSEYTKLPARDTISIRSGISRLPSLASDRVPLVKGHNEHDRTRNLATTSKLWIFAWWAPEIIASLLSVAAFAAIVGILRKYEGRGISEITLPFSTTLNGMIAALATLNRAFLVAPLGSALMQELWLFYAAEAHKTLPSSRLIDLKAYDEASRNAWGAIKFLLRRRRPRPFAYIAAIAIIASLAVGTTLQQIVSFASLVPVASDSPLLPGNLPRSESWNAVHGIPSQDLDASYPPYDLIAAIYDGALGGGISPLKASCESGNCTFPLTPSLGVCGACMNTTFTRQCYDACPPADSTSNCKKLPGLMCNYTLVSGSRTELVNLSYPNPGLLPGFQVISRDGGPFNGTADNKMFIANFDMVGIQYVADPKDYPETKVAQAWECALWMCVQTYETVVTSTNQNDTVDSVMDQQVSPYTFPPLAVTGHPPIKYQVSEYAIKTLANYFKRSFQGTAFVDDSTARLSSDLIAGIWNGTTDPQGWIQNVATSMSNIVRSTNSSSRPEYNGNAYQLGVSVRWAWLTLPAVLVTCSVLLLAIVMTRTAFSDVEAWKGSPLTLLLLRVDGRILEASPGALNEYRGPEKSVGRERVRLRRTPRGAWGLTAC